MSAATSNATSEAHQRRRIIGGSFGNFTPETRNFDLRHSHKSVPSGPGVVATPEEPAAAERVSR